MGKATQKLKKRVVVKKISSDTHELFIQEVLNNKFQEAVSKTFNNLGDKYLQKQMFYTMQ